MSALTGTLTTMATDNAVDPSLKERPVLINSRTALYCHEYLHKTFAPNHFKMTEVITDNPLTEALKDAGIRHEAEVLESLEQLGLRILRISPDLSDSQRVSATRAALARTDLDFIYGSLFISDTRISKTDLLANISSSANKQSHWAPVDIKSHNPIGTNQSNLVHVTDLPSVSPDLGTKRKGRLPEKDAYQLAHYYRHMQQLNLAGDIAWAGIIGTDSSKIVWADLNELMLGQKHAATNILDAYDADAADAVKVIKKSIERNKDLSKPPVTIARRISGDFGCPVCEFKLVCKQELEEFDEGFGHATLLANVTANHAREVLDGAESIRELTTIEASSNPKRAAKIRAQVWLSEIPQLIHPEEKFVIPAFDIEIDIDLENSQEAVHEADIDESIGRDAVYLYGYGIHERYKNPDWKTAKFAYFDDYSDTDEAEYQVLSQMWNLLVAQVKLAEQQGKSIGIFHYSHHEKQWWQKFAKNHSAREGVPTLVDVESFIDKYFVDLLPLARKVALPVTGYSIKTLAPLAGFNWRVDDAGGGNSIVYFQQASSPTSSDQEKSAAIAWLRSYNADDVRATFAVRAYLRSLIPTL